MKKKKEKAKASSLKAEYDLSKGIRGKYAGRFAEGSNIIVLDPDVAKIYKGSRQVNAILRALSRIVVPKSR